MFMRRSDVVDPIEMVRDITVVDGEGATSPFDADRLERALAARGVGSQAPVLARSIGESIRIAGMRAVDTGTLGDLIEIASSAMGPVELAGLLAADRRDSFGESLPATPGVRLPGVDLDVERLLQPAAVHVLRQPDEYGIEGLDDLVEGVVRVRTHQGLDPEEARAVATETFREGMDREFPDPGGEALERLEEGSRLAADAMIADATLADRFPNERLEGPGQPSDGTIPIGEYTSRDYYLRVSIHRIHCREETPPAALTDDIVYRGSFEYEDRGGDFRTFEGPFDTATWWPASGGKRESRRTQSRRRHQLTIVRLEPNKRSRFLGTNQFFEDDVLSLEMAEFVEDVSLALLTAGVSIAVEVAASAAQSAITDAVDEGTISEDAGDLLSDAVDDAMDGAGEAVSEKFKEALDGIIAGALGPELLVPYPFSTEVRVDWSDPTSPPRWVPLLDGRPQALERVGVDEVESEWLDLSESHRRGPDRENYRIKLVFEVLR